MSTRIDANSVRAICGNSTHAMVFGTDDCYYTQIQAALQTQADSPIQRVFDFRVGDDAPPPTPDLAIPIGAVTTLEGRRLTQFPSGAAEAADGSQRIKRKCKTALVDVVGDNYLARRAARQAGRTEPPIIPILFSIDRDGNPYPLEAENVVSRSRVIRGRRMNNIITHAELRRAYKLCNDPRLHPDIRAIAQETFKFIRLRRITGDNAAVGQAEEYALVSIPAPWQDPAWSRSWEVRQCDQTPRVRAHHWLRDLNGLVAATNENNAAMPASSPASRTPSPTLSATNTEAAPPLLVVSPSASRTPSPTPSIASSAATPTAAFRCLVVSPSSSRTPSPTLSTASSAATPTAATSPLLAVISDASRTPSPTPSIASSAATPTAATSPLLAVISAPGTASPRIPILTPTPTPRSVYSTETGTASAATSRPASAATASSGGLAAARSRRSLRASAAASPSASLDQMLSQLSLNL